MIASNLITAGVFIGPISLTVNTALWYERMADPILEIGRISLHGQDEEMATSGRIDTILRPFTAQLNCLTSGMSIKAVYFCLVSIDGIPAVASAGRINSRLDLRVTAFQMDPNLGDQTGIRVLRV
ncbi:hypothetical protein GGR57DRAFT_99801 [Xylariaceae sp. FL1272]|nr:hypothetical protein GGR57DRAFT_99801 [Xylariaceae sp. FL1272]